MQCTESLIHKIQHSVDFLKDFFKTDLVLFVKRKEQDEFRYLFDSTNRNNQILTKKFDSQEGKNFLYQVCSEQEFRQIDNIEEHKTFKLYHSFLQPYSTAIILPVCYSAGDFCGAFCLLHSKPLSLSDRSFKVFNHTVQTIKDHISACIESEKLNLAFKNQLLAWWDYDVPSGHVEYSPNKVTMLGYLPEEFPNDVKKICDLLHPDDYEATMQRMRDCFSGKRPNYEVIYRIRAKSGEYFWFYDKGEIIERQPDKSPKRIFGIVFNITEQKVAEERLRESRQNYKAIADFTYDWEYWIKPDESFAYVSPSCERITGYKPEEYLDNKSLLKQIILSDDKELFDKHRHNVMKHVESEYIEFRIKTKNNTTKWIGHHCQPIFDDNGNYCGHRGSNRDITEKKQLEIDLRHHQQNLESLIRKRTKELTGSNQKLAKEIKDHKETVKQLNLANSKLKEEEELFRIMAENFPNGSINLIDSNLRFIKAGGKEFKDFGLDPDSFSGKHLQDVLSPEISKYAQKNIRKTFAGIQTNYQVEYKGQYYQNTIVPISDDKSHITSALLIINNITELKKAEQNLIRSEEKYKFLYENTNDLICLHEPNGRYVTISPSSKRLLGYHPDELTGEDPYLLYHPDDVDRIRAESHEKAKKGQTVQIEYRIKRKNGTYCWFDTITDNIRDKDGNITYLITSSRDVTAQKQAEEALKESHNLLELFFRQPLDGFFFMMLDNPAQWDESVDKEKTLDYIFEHQHITKVNQAMLDQYGFSEEQFLQFTPNDFFAHDIEHGKNVWRKMLDEGKLKIDTAEKKVDGTDIWIEGNYICIYDDNGLFKGHFGIQRDVTERKQAKEALQNSEARLRHAQEIAHLGNWELDVASGNMFWSDELYRICGFEPGSIQPGFENLLSVICKQDREIFRKTVIDSAANKKPFQLEIRINKPGNLEGHVLAQGNIFKYPEKSGDLLEGIYLDITERKQFEQALSHESNVNKAIAALLESLIVSKSLEDITNLLLEQSKSLTGSKHGFVGYIDEKNGYLICPSISIDIWDKQQFTEKNIIFKEFSGLWGWVLKNKTSLYTNSPSCDPRSTGTPPGHMPIERFLSVPAIIDKKLVGAIGLANSVNDYNDNDLQIIERFAEIFAIVLQRQKTETALFNSEKKYRLLFENMMNGFCLYKVLYDHYGNPHKLSILDMNPVFKMLGEPAAGENNIKVQPVAIPGENLDIIKSWSEVALTGTSKRTEFFLKELNKHFQVFLFSPEKDHVAAIFDDITLRKEAEFELENYKNALEELVDFRTSQLRKSERKYRELFTSMRDGFARVDSNMKIAECNPAFEEITGYSFVELNHMSVYELTPAKWHHTEDTILDKQVRVRGFSDVYEKEYIRKDGSIIPIEIQAYLIKEKGVETGMWALVKNISLRKETQKKLIESEHRLKLALNTANEGIFDWKIKTDEVYINPEWREKLGVSDSEQLLYSQNLLTLVHPDDQEIIRRAFIHSIVNKDPGFSVEHRLVPKDGNERYYYLNAGSIEYDNNGKPVRITGTHVDITQLKQAEEALKISEEKYRTLVEHSNEWIWEIDNNNRYTYSSPGVKNILGFETQEILFKTPFDFMPKDEGNRIRKCFDEIAQQKKSFRSLENVNIHKNGQKVILETSGTPILDEDGNLKGYRGIDRDITSRKEMDKLLVATIIETEEKERNRFAKDLHDSLGALLSGIKMYLNLLSSGKIPKESFGAIIDKTRDLISQAVKTTREIAMNIKPPELSKYGLIGSIKSLCEKMADTGMPEIHLNTDRFTTKVKSDVELIIYRITSELINNSLKHADAKNIRITLFNEDNRMMLIYSDDGKGFDTEKVMMHETSGGLGLSNISSRIESLHGKCNIQGVPGSGMDAVIEFPVDG
jgi:PAS domain S-box-containing protein